MRALLRHPVRVGSRFLWFCVEAGWVAVRYVGCCAFRSGAAGTAARARWLQQGCGRVLRVFGAQVRLESDGPPPASGLLVCNHLSYLDILVFSSITPAVFVSKREIKGWPVVGWFATLAGTLFADRQRRTQVAELARDIRGVLDTGVAVVLFPEGTNSDGTTILPFKSSLLEPATGQAHPLHVGLIRYELDDGDVRSEVCFVGRVVFFMHALNLLGKRSVRASVKFRRIAERSADRKELARQLRAELLRMREG